VRRVRSYIEYRLVELWWSDTKCCRCGNSASFISDYCVQLHRGSNKEISGWIKINSPRPSQQLSIEVPEVKIHKRYTIDSSGCVYFSFPASVSFWTPEHPALYDVILASGLDSVRDRIGLEQLKRKDLTFFLMVSRFSQGHFYP